MNQSSREDLYQEKLARARRKEVENKLKKELNKTGINEAVDEIEASQSTILSRFIIIIAIVADVFGLIPIIGNITGIFFGVVLVVLYFLDGAGGGLTKNQLKRKTRKWLLRAVIYGIEILFPPLSWLPLFTIEALIAYNLNKRGYYKKIEKAEKIINKFK